MPRSCSVCSSKKRDQIDECLVKKTPYRNISKRFGISTATLSRHVNEGHIQEKVQKSKDLKDASEGLDLQVAAKQIYDLCLRAAQKAETEDLRSVGSCITPAVKVLEMLNKGNDGKKEPPKESAFWASYMDRAGEVFVKQA